MAAFSWLAMMVVHEFGHALHAWLSGGVVAKMVLHPLAFSRTDMAINPHPLFVVWGGAIWGCIIPLVLLIIVHFLKWHYEYLVAWWAGFCCMANGAYLAAGTLFRSNGRGADDASVILQNGGAWWQLILYGLITVPLGLWLWNGLGPNFGLGSAQGKVDRKAVIGITIALVILVLGEILIT